jgi:P-type Ca2+ transporter type 2C
MLASLVRPVSHRWRRLAILWELVLLALIILPFLCVLFDTFRLPLVECIIIVGLALTVSPVPELAKWMERRG